VRKLIIVLSAVGLLGNLSTSMAQANSALPRSVSIATSSVGGTYYIYGGGLASLITEKLGVRASAEVTQGPTHNILLLHQRDVQLALLSIGPAAEGWFGEGDWAKGKQFRDMRGLFPFAEAPFHFIATERSGVCSVKGMERKAVGVGPRGGTPGSYVPRIMEHLRIPFTPRFAGAGDLASQLMDGLVDAFGHIAPVPIAAFSEIEAQRKVCFFSFDDQQRKQIRDKFPFLAETVIPAGTYSQLTKDLPTLGIGNVVAAHRELSDDFVYRLVKAVYDNRDYMMRIHKAAEGTKPENISHFGFLWLHPGAIRYYREIGVRIPDQLYPPGHPR